jgi:hypothetical protein
MTGDIGFFMAFGRLAANFLNEGYSTLRETDVDKNPFLA